MDTLVWSLVSLDVIGPEERSLHSTSVLGDERLFLYGGFNNMCTPLSDAWLLHLRGVDGTDGEQDRLCNAFRVKYEYLKEHFFFKLLLGFQCQPLWQEVPLRYDHGEPRCWHGQAVTKSGEVIIHSGLTQEYYLNRVQLDTHAEDVLSLQFGPRTLLREALEYILKRADLFESSFESLPKNLREIIDLRINGQNISEGDPPKEDPFDREVIHAGI